MTLNYSSVVDAAIFEHLQAKIDEDAEVREQFKGILLSLEKQGRHCQAVLAKVHSTPSDQLNAIITDAEKSIDEHTNTVTNLAEIASQFSYYKYNNIWTRDIQNTVFLVLFTGYLGGLQSKVEGAKPGRLLTIEDVGAVLNIPVNLKDRDALHLTIEEYLQALITLIDELARLAINSVTLGDYQRPLLISSFIKDVHAGFQILNLKNDSLRRRSDSIKYSVKKVEDVVYDLSLQNLIPRAAV